MPVRDRSRILEALPLALLSLKARRSSEFWAPPTDAQPSISLLEFIRTAWPLLEPSVPFVPGWHLGLLAEHLEACARGQIADLLINVPPGTTKSLTVGVFWPAWTWTWAPWTRWLTSCYDARLAVRDALRTRRLMQSEWYQSSWRRQFRFASDQNIKSYYANDRTGWRLATSMSGAVTGEHAHYVVVDDPHNVSQAESDLERETVLTTWREVYPSRRLPGGTRVVVGQRVHEEDLTADWLARESERIHHLELAMEFEPDHVRQSQLEPCVLTGLPHEPRTTPGELLAPERFDAERVAQLKTDLGPYAYAAQYEQSPTPRVGMVLNPAWFVDRPDDLDTTDMDIVMAWDLNYSEKDSSDWTVAVTAAVDRDPKAPMIHILDVYADHLASERHEVELAEYISLWQPLLVGIEKRAWERQGATRDLVRSINARLEAEGARACTIEPIDPDTDKVSRAMIITGRAKANRISVDRQATWWHALSSEMARFPRSAHDDRVDALAYLVRLVAEKLQTARAWASVMHHPLQITRSGPLVGGKRPR